MHRTKSRALVTGQLTPSQALVFGVVLIILGIATLSLFTNLYATGMALVGFGVYVFLYTPLKPRSPIALFVGAVAGAMPPVVGYAAASGTLDYYALVLFVLLFIWQIPHFLAIAFKNFADYSAAGVPLFIKRAPQNDKEKKFARIIFFGSLILLLVACLATFLWRLWLA